MLSLTIYLYKIWGYGEFPMKIVNGYDVYFIRDFIMACTVGYFVGVIGYRNKSNCYLITGKKKPKSAKSNTQFYINFWFFALLLFTIYLYKIWGYKEYPMKIVNGVDLYLIRDFVMSSTVGYFVGVIYMRLYDNRYLLSGKKKPEPIIDYNESDEEDDEI